MDYADVVATFCGPRPAGTPLPGVVRAGGPARRLRDACEPLAMHAVWNRRTNERLAALGLDFLTGYVGGRAASLGEPSPPVVAAAFAGAGHLPEDPRVRHRRLGGRLTRLRFGQMRSGR